ncbi:MAG TPA: GatB/YqeY domain-containing protein [Candidatus Saccharimonadales bacterium]|nr:GatB/YqeY domain-containing protein [Candidatus Saccharimonadales bacterium]
MLEQRLNEDMKAAMRAADAERLSTIRMLRSELLKLKKDGSGRTELPDADVVRVLGAYAKKVKEALEQAEGAGRPELVEQARRELLVVEGYLPQQLSDAELDTLVAGAAAAVGAAGPKDMGKVMKEAQAQAAGRVDGRRLSEAVKRFLSA